MQEILKQIPLFLCGPDSKSRAVCHFCLASDRRRAIESTKQLASVALTFVAEAFSPHDLGTNLSRLTRLMEEVPQKGKPATFRKRAEGARPHFDSRFCRCLLFVTAGSMMVVVANTPFPGTASFGELVP